MSEYRTDIEALRRAADSPALQGYNTQLFRDAADELDALRAELARLTAMPPADLRTVLAYEGGTKEAQAELQQARDSLAETRRIIAELATADALLRVIRNYAPTVPLPPEQVQQIHMIAAAAIERGLKTNTRPEEVLARVGSGMFKDAAMADELQAARARVAELTRGYNTAQGAISIALDWLLYGPETRENRNAVLDVLRIEVERDAALRGGVKQ